MFLTQVASTRPSKPFQVAIVGAGAFGLWIARECQRRGKSTLLLDARGTANSLASSGDESRILRVGYGPQHLYTEWASRSLRRWTELLSMLGAASLFQKSGFLWMGPETERYLTGTATTLGEQRVNHEILTARQIYRAYPSIHVPGGFMGILEKESGFILARRALQILAAHLIGEGVAYKTAAITAPVEIDDATVSTLITTTGEYIHAEQFVFACGPWLPKLFPKLLAPLMRITRQEVYYFAVPHASLNFNTPHLPAWVEINGQAIFYGIPNSEARGFKAALDNHGGIIDPDTEDRLPSKEVLARVRHFVSERFPDLARAPCVESRVCQYENTPAGDFVIDRHPSASNVWLAGGGSGHGFKHGPAIGEFVASLLDGGNSIKEFTIEHATAQKHRTVH